MKRNFRYSKTAARRVIAITRFSIDQFGEAQAERYVQGLEDAIAKAVSNARLRRPRPEFGADLFSVRYESHTAYLSKSGNGWVVIDILHGRMDHARHLSKSEKP